MIPDHTKYYPFWNLTFTLIIILILPDLLMDGMFSDGVLYSSISKNLAHGLGSFWFPYFSETAFPFFHQQPPLTFGIQALFFKAFGDSIYVERFYSLLTFLISAFLIHQLWKTIYYENLNEKRMSWLPILLWIIIPVCYWAYSNNVEENTMGIFTLTGVILIFKGLHKRENPIYLILGTIATVLASLCKGFPGLFPIIIPFLYWMVFRSYTFKRMIFFLCITFGTLLLAYTVILLYQEARISLSSYLYDRVINSIQNVSTENDRFYLIKQLLVELLSPLVLMAIISLILKAKSISLNKTEEEKKMIRLLLLIAISASFPLIVTLEQRRFYLVTSLPFYAIAFAMWIAPGLNLLINNMTAENFKWLKRISYLIVTAACCYSLLDFGKTGRDADKLHDVYLLGEIITPGKTIKVFPETWNDWGLHNYFVRHFNISLSKDDTEYDYILTEQLSNHPIPSGYTKLNETTKRYDLYKRKTK